MGFYWRLDESTGLKVYMGFPTGKKPWVSKPRVVQKAHKTMNLFYKAGLSPEPMGIQRVYVALGMPKDVKPDTVIDTPWALRMQHIHYDENKWFDYAMGRPYAWGEERDHCPEGFLDFVSKVKAFQKQHKIKLSAATWKTDEVPKLGDVMWCTKKERFYLVDVD